MNTKTSHATYNSKRRTSASGSSSLDDVDPGQYMAGYKVFPAQGVAQAVRNGDSGGPCVDTASLARGETLLGRLLPRGALLHLLGGELLGAEQIAGRWPTAAPELAQV